MKSHRVPKRNPKFASWLPGRGGRGSASLLCVEVEVEAKHPKDPCFFEVAVGSHASAMDPTVLVAKPFVVVDQRRFGGTVE